MRTAICHIIRFIICMHVLLCIDNVFFISSSLLKTKFREMKNVDSYKCKNCKKLGIICRHFANSPCNPRLTCRKERARALALQFELCSKQVADIASEGSTFVKSCQFPGFINKEALMTHTNVLNAVLMNITTLSTQQRSSETPSEEVVSRK